MPKCVVKEVDARSKYAHQYGGLIRAAVSSKMATFLQPSEIAFWNTFDVQAPRAPAKKFAAILSNRLEGLMTYTVHDPVRVAKQLLARRITHQKLGVPTKFDMAPNIGAMTGLQCYDGNNEKQGHAFSALHKSPLLQKVADMDEALKIGRPDLAYQEVYEQYGADIQWSRQIADVIHKQKWDETEFCAPSVDVDEDYFRRQPVISVDHLFLNGENRAEALDCLVDYFVDQRHARFIDVILEESRELDLGMYLTDEHLFDPTGIDVLRKNPLGGYDEYCVLARSAVEDWQAYWRLLN